MSETPAKRKQPRPMTPKQAKLAMEIARLSMGGATYEEIAAALSVSVQTVRRRRRHPDYDRAVERARAVVRHESEVAAEAGRAEALEAARAVVRAYNSGALGVSASDANNAGKSLLAASAPTPAVYDARARKAFLAALTAGTRALVIAETQGSHPELLADLSDEELAAISRRGDE